MEFSSPIGIIAGNGRFPIECAKGARARGLKVVCCAHVGETERSIEALSDHCEWIKVGELGKIIETFKRHSVQQVCLAGGIKRVRLFGGVRFDLRTIAMLSKLRTTKDDAVLRAVASEIERDGMRVFSAVHLLSGSESTPGLLTERALSEGEANDARIGWEAAQAIGSLDIGQTVVVKDGVIVAVEAIEGTDRCIARAGELCGAGAVVVKVCKPQQDVRMDLPTIGPDTVKSMSRAGIAALVIESGRSIILGREEVARAANAAGVTILAAPSLDAISDGGAPKG